MRTGWIAAAAVAALVSLPLRADMGSPMGDCSMGPGMMGGNGPGGMGHGMMGGYGPGERMGHGMMAGREGDSYEFLKLDEAQRSKIYDIRKDQRRKQFALMESAREARFQYSQLERSGKADDAAQRKAYDAMADVHKQMFEARLDARKRIEAVLTPEQREQFGRAKRGGMGE